MTKVLVANQYGRVVVKREYPLIVAKRPGAKVLVKSYGSGIGEALIDGKQYARQDGGWVEVSGIIDDTNIGDGRILVYNAATEKLEYVDRQKSYTIMKTTTINLATAGTAYLLPPSEQTDRKSIIISNISEHDIFYGDDTVTALNGIVLEAGRQVSLDIEKDLYAVCATDDVSINVLELK